MRKKELKKRDQLIKNLLKEQQTNDSHNKTEEEKSVSNILKHSFECLEKYYEEISNEIY